MISRRKVLGATVAGAGVMRRVGAQIMRGVTSDSIPTSDVDFLSSETNPMPTGATKVAPPKMSRHAAQALIRSNPEVLAQIRSELAKRVKANEHMIDPDLAVLRAFSPMAKLVFTHQRRVEELFTHEIGIKKPFFDVAERYIRKLMWGED